MSIDTRSRRRGTSGWTKMFALIFAGVMLAGCGGEAADTEMESTNAPVVQDQPVQAPAAPAMEEPATIADIFPEGEGRELVLNNCASCHAVACAAIGQRPPNRWDELREAHREHVISLSDEDLQTTFAYLRENFSSDQPEPNVPSRFLERGCTPF